MAIVGRAKATCPMRLFGPPYLLDLPAPTDRRCGTGCGVEVTANGDTHEEPTGHGYH